MPDPVSAPVPEPVIVITEFMDDAAVAGMAAAHPVRYDPSLVDDRARLMASLGTARALVVRNRTQVDAALLDAAPDLAVIGRLGVGLDNIDLDACRARGIQVCPATGANADAVAEYVIAAALILRRGAFGATAQVIAGDWPRTRLIGREVAGAEMGLVGFGAIARAVAARARALGMTVSAFDPHLPADDPAWEAARRIDLDTLLAGADIVSLHVPLTPETRGLIDTARIAAMKPGAIIINTARGGTVDEAALAAALGDGRLGGAALDVFEAEPLDAAAGAPFKGIPNLILTPHIAGLTAESNLRVGALTAQNVLAALAGER